MHKTSFDPSRLQGASVCSFLSANPNINPTAGTNPTPTCKDQVANDQRRRPVRSLVSHFHATAAGKNRTAIAYHPEDSSHLRRNLAIEKPWRMVNITKAKGRPHRMYRFTIICTQFFGYFRSVDTYICKAVSFSLNLIYACGSYNQQSPKKPKLAPLSLSKKLRRQLLLVSLTNLQIPLHLQ